MQQILKNKIIQYKGKSHVNYSLKINSSSRSKLRDWQQQPAGTARDEEKKKHRNNYNHVVDMIADEVWYMSEPHMSACARVCAVSDSC